MNERYRSKQNTRVRTTAVATALLALATTSVPAQEYKWLGGTDNDFALPANWEGGTAAPSGNTYLGRRISVMNGAGNPLYYTAAQGATIYQNTGGTRALFIGSGAAGAMSITGGSFESQVATEDGLSNNYDGSLTIDGGSYTKTAGANTTFLVKYGSAGTGTLTINGGEFKVGYVVYRVASGGSAGGAGIVNLNGGTLSAYQVKENLTPNGTTSTFNFNGGTLKVGGSAMAATFMQGLDFAYVQAGGAIIDTAGYSVTIGQALLDGGGNGGLTKQGAGDLTLSGDTTALAGTVTITAGRILLSTNVSDGPAAAWHIGGTSTLIGGASSNGNHTRRLGALSGDAGATLRAGITGDGTTTFEVGALGTDTTFSGTIVNFDADTQTALRKVGNGTLTLGGASAYTGSTYVNAGTLKLSGGPDRLPVTTILRLGAAGGQVGYVDLNGCDQRVGIVTLESGAGATCAVRNTAGTPATLTVNNSGTWTYAGRVEGDVRLTKSNSGPLTLSGAVERSNVTVTAGTLNGSAAMHFSISGASNDRMTVTGGTLDIRSMTLDIDVGGGGATQDEYVLVDYSAGGTLIANAGSPFFASVIDVPPGYSLAHNPDQRKIVLARDSLFEDRGTVFVVR